MGNKIIFEGESKKNLRTHEIKAIILLLEHFKADITCINISSTKTPDLRINGIEWELKAPLGTSPRTIENILKKAEKQSTNIVLDLSRSKMHELQALARTKHFLRNSKHSIKRLLVITRNRKIIDLKDEL